MKRLYYLKKEFVINGDNKDVENVGGEKKLEMIYKKLRKIAANEINFRILSYENFKDFVEATGYDNNEITTKNLYYELKDSCYSNN